MTAKGKKITKRIFDAIFIVFLVFMVIVIALSVYSKKSGRKIFSYSFLWVLTDSMEPTIPAQSYVLTKSATIKDIKVGDIITFISSDPAIKGQYNTHRVVAINNDIITTKGDNCPEEDFYKVQASDIVAKYIRNMPVMTFFGRFFASTYGLAITLFVIIGGCGIWIAILIAKGKKEISKDNKQKEIDRLVKEEVKRLEREGLKDDKDDIKDK